MEQGSFNLAQNRGHKGPVLRPRCIGPGEGPYPNYDSILLYSKPSHNVQMYNADAALCALPMTL